MRKLTAYMEIDFYIDCVVQIYSTKYLLRDGILPNSQLFMSQQVVMLYFQTDTYKAASIYICIFIYILNYIKCFYSDIRLVGRGRGMLTAAYSPRRSGVSQGGKYNTLHRLATEASIAGITWESRSRIHWGWDKVNAILQTTCSYTLLHDGIWYSVVLWFVCH